MKALVLGSSGLIGSHMVTRLRAEGYWVRGVDIRYPEFHKEESDEFIQGDLRDPQFVKRIISTSYQEPFVNVEPFDEIYQLAADMGGAGYIFTGEHDADVMHNSGLININVANYAQLTGAKKLFYSSSACIYPKELQNHTPSDKIEHETHTETGFTCSLKESDAWPANPDSDYGVEKIFSERLYLAYARNYGLNVRIARFHNIFGPNSPFDGQRAKAPAAMCRKVIEQVAESRKLIKRDIAVEVWGDGKQTRSFLYIDDCIDAVRLLMESDFKEPINIGSEEMISINDLAQMAIDISGKNIKIKNIDGPVGVRGRNSDNTLIEKVLGWKPKYSLHDGMVKTFAWIRGEIERKVV